MAALEYYPDSQPGIRRRRRGRGFSYICPDGTSVSDTKERARLNALAVPPAYEDVWMCPVEFGHLQATGRDQRGRKQYKYHVDWTAAQAQTKFDALIPFAHALPRIRRRMYRDLAQDAGEKSFALASAVALIDKLSLRVGSAEYTRENGSYGALTLRRKHVQLEGSKVSLRYTAKGGKRVRKQMSDRTLARVLGIAGDLPGVELLTWVDGDGEPQTLNSSALNSYLAQAADDDTVTAKSFRTWSGTLAAFEVASAGRPATIKDVAQAAAKRLHNTPTIARNSYIHPSVIDLAETGHTAAKANKLNGLYAAEKRLLGFLESL